MLIAGETHILKMAIGEEYDMLLINNTVYVRGPENFDISISISI